MWLDISVAALVRFLSKVAVVREGGGWGWGRDGLQRDVPCIEGSVPSVQDGRSGLFMASSNGHLEVVRLLIENGAEVNSAAQVLYFLTLSDFSRTPQANTGWQGWYWRDRTKLQSTKQN